MSHGSQCTRRVSLFCIGYFTSKRENKGGPAVRTDLCKHSRSVPAKKRLKKDGEKESKMKEGGGGGGGRGGGENGNKDLQIGAHHPKKH